MCLEVRAEFFSCHTESCSRRLERVSAVDRDFLMNNIGLYFWSSSSLKLHLLKHLKLLGKDRAYHLLRG